MRSTTETRKDNTARADRMAEQLDALAPRIGSRLVRRYSPSTRGIGSVNVTVKANGTTWAIPFSLWRAWRDRGWIEMVSERPGSDTWRRVE